MKFKNRKMCKQCPWRNNAAQGWLGTASPENMTAQIDFGTKMPCHSTVNYDDPNWQAQLQTDKAQYCTGVLQASNKACKVPRDLEHAKAVNHVTLQEDHMSIEEFTEYHNQATVKSWEL